jgi:hypothetical protein
MVGVIGEPQANMASVALHDRMGFRDVGRIERSGYKFGRWLDTALMQRAIGDEDGDGVARPLLSHCAMSASISSRPTPRLLWVAATYTECWTVKR